MRTIHTRVGQIVDGDNYFFGRSVFADWVDHLAGPTDVVLLALGLREPTPAARECMRLLSLATISPDARVWPLKLTRLLASHGDPLAGHFGGQLVCTSAVMGPGAAVQAARGLAWVAEQVGEHPDDAAVARAVADWRAREGGRFSGFGVPFRAVDERRVGLLRLAAGGPLPLGRHWRLHEQVVACMPHIQPNVVITIVAMLLDIGVAPGRAGVALAALMSPVFLAHAVEAADIDGERAHALPPACVDYRGAPARDSRTDRSAPPPHAALRRAPG